MEVLTRSNRFMQEEESELNSAAFSWMAAVEQKEVFSMKKAFSRFKYQSQSVTTQSLVDSAFEEHHFMFHCFARFRQALYRNRIQRFRRRKLLSKSFNCWLEYNQTCPGDPVRDGTIVYACFKWISATLGRDNNNNSRIRGHGGAASVDGDRFLDEQLYYYSGDDSGCYAAQGRLIAATYPHLLPHIDACMSLHLPIAKVPLLLHATAMLDAHSLQKHFHLWRSSIERNKLCAEYVKRQHMACLLHTSFRSWNTLTVLKTFRAFKCRQRLHQYMFKWQRHAHIHKQNKTLFRHCSAVGVTNSCRRAMRALDIHSRRRVDARELMQHAEEVKLRRDLHSTLHHWYNTIKHHKHILYASQVTQQKQWHSSTEVAFGVWLLNAARRINMKRNANTIVINRFSNLTKSSFDSWKQLSDESRRKKAELDMEMKERAKALHDKLVMLKVIRMVKVINTAWVVWRMQFKAKRFSRPLTRYINKLKLYSAFMKWNLINNLSQIANCMQKLWRGHAVRHLTHRNKSRYIRWIMSGKLRSVLAFHVLMTKSKVLRHWQRFIRSSQHAKDLYSQRVVQLRSLRVMYRSIHIRRKVRLANDNGYHFKITKQTLKAFSTMKLSVLLKKHYFKSIGYCRSKQLKHAVTTLFLKRLSGLCGYVSTGKRLLMSMSLRKNIANLRPIVSFIKMRFFSRWLNKTRAYRVNETRVLVLARQNTLWRALARWRAYGDAVYAHNKRYNDDTPEVFGHRYYHSRMKRKYLQLFRYRLLASKGRRLRSFRSLHTSATHHRRKVLSRYCSHLRNSVIDRQRQIRKVRRRYLRPLFKLWHREFRRNHYYSKRIYQLQVKIMRRISKNVFLAWRLYAMKATRLHQLASIVISHQTRSSKEKVMDKWVSARTEKVMKPRVDIVEERIDDWIKLRALRKWHRVFQSFESLTWKSVRVTYFYWAKLVRDTKVTRKALQKAEYYDCVRQAKKGLRDWHYMTVVHRNLRLWECDSRRRMLVWKAKGMLQYWRRKCWWQGRRVLWSRTRVLHRAPEKRFLVSRRRNKTVDFFSASSSTSHFGASAAALSSSSSSSFASAAAISRRQLPMESVWEGGPGSGSTAVRDSRTNTRARMRTGAFIAPLAHEALLIRSLRRWKKRVAEDTLHIKHHTSQSCFIAWKKHTFILAAKRAAFVNRLQLFDRKLVLQHVFVSLRFYQSRHAAENKCRDKLHFLKKLHFFQKWSTCFKIRQDRAKQVSVVNKMLRHMTHMSGAYKIQLAFSIWRVSCRASPNLNKLNHKLMQVTWVSWQLNYRATRFWRRSWLQKFFLAWFSRVDKLGRTRGCLTQMRHAAMMVEARLVKMRIERLRFAFDSILVHVDMSSFKTNTDWKGLVSQCRGSHVESPSRRRRSGAGAGEEVKEGSHSKHHHTTHTGSSSSSTFASPSTSTTTPTTTLGGVHSVLSRLALTSSPSSPYHTPSGSSPPSRTRDRSTSRSRSRGISKFSSFLEKKTTAAYEHTDNRDYSTSPPLQAARRLAMASPPPPLRSPHSQSHSQSHSHSKASARTVHIHNKTPERHLDISEL